jgi:predicted polyphosphate/ATP-dependent NAD kinase
LSGLIVIVCGGRDYDDRVHLYRILGKLSPVRVIHGGCPTGADWLASCWAEVQGVEVDVFHAEWGRHGRAAGPIRNSAMAKSGADLLLAFPGGKGTASMIKEATNYMPVLRVEPSKWHGQENRQRGFKWKS